MIGLCREFLDSRHLHHGRLLSAGFPRGADDLDVYDAACLVLADAERNLSTRTEFSYNPDGDKEFRSMMEKLLRPSPAMSGAVQSVDELRAQMAARAAERRPKPTE